MGFGPVIDVSSVLSNLSVPWWITGGWAIDLAIGQPTRPHEDVDVVLLERDEHALRTDLPDVELQLTVGPDDEEQPWPSGRRLVAGPDRVRLISPRLSSPTQILFGAAVGTTWVYHRGKPTITRPLAEATNRRYGVPFLGPEVVLATKPSPQRDKDHADFGTALALLNEDQRHWLMDEVERRWRADRRRLGGPEAATAEHPWTARLAGTG
jgi:Aminoglycoside-2''-adenylyltransferase